MAIAFDGQLRQFAAIAKPRSVLQACRWRVPFARAAIAAGADARGEERLVDGGGGRGVDPVGRDDAPEAALELRAPRPLRRRGARARREDVGACALPNVHAPMRKIRTRQPTQPPVRRASIAMRRPRPMSRQGQPSATHAPTVRTRQPRCACNGECGTRAWPWAKYVCPCAACPCMCTCVGVYVNDGLKQGLQSGRGVGHQR